MFLLDHFGLTDAGKVRENNEDALLAGDGTDRTLFAVADGIGGFEAGEVASSMAIERLRQLQPAQPMREAIEEANDSILREARQNTALSGMGTTLVALRFSGEQGEPLAEVAHVGDSRAYLLRGERMHPLTEDHSLVEELVKSGDLTRAEAFKHPQKNLITRALGAEEEIEVDISTVSVREGDRILLCTDGLTDMVPEEQLAELLARSGAPEPTARRLISAAIEAGGSDNVTAVVVDVRRDPQAASSASPPDDTREMELFTQPQPTPPPRRRMRIEGDRKRRGRGLGKRAFQRFIRLIAVALVLAVAAAPFYAWGQSRYFMGFEGNELVVYQGLPYAPLGVELNREDERPGIKKSEVKEPYQAPIENHTIYSGSELQKVLRDLER